MSLQQGPHLLPGAGELRPGVARQHVDDDHLAPLLHVHQQVTQLPVVLVDQINAIRAHVLEGHHNAAGHKLEEISQRKWKNIKNKIRIFIFLWTYFPVKPLNEVMDISSSFLLK